MTDLQWAISLNRLMLKVIGLWPPDNKDAYKILRLELRLLFNIMTLLFVLMIPTSMALIKVWGDMILMIDNLQYSLPILMAISKVCIIWYKQEAVAHLIDMIKTDWMKDKIKEERDVMLKYAKVTRTIAMCGIFMIICSATITIALPYFGVSTRHITNVTDAGKPLPIPSYYLHDVSKSPQFEITLVAQGIMSVTTAIFYSATDNLLGLLVIHVCGQLKILHSRLVHMERFPNFDAVLKYNVEDHIRLIRSIRNIDDIFNIMLLCLMLYFGIIFCLQGFLVVNVVKQKRQFSFSQLAFLSAAIFYVLLHMCLYCGVGEILVTQSGNIHRATCEYAWYTIKPKAAKNLIFIMLCSNKPFYITAGKIFPMTMATLCTLLKTSAGYISVLLANQD